MTEIFRLFKLGLDPSFEAQYTQVGRQNFKQSMALEAGTLAMFGAHVENSPLQKIVVERYASEAAYQAHVASSHFKSFAEMAKAAFISRQVINLEPAIFLQKSEPMRNFAAAGLSVRLAQVEVSDSQAFSAIVLPEMRASMETEAGVLVMYAGKDTANPNIWYFFEVYQNEAAYTSHCQTPHFKDYINKTQDLVLNKDLQVLTGEMLVHQ
ncbi:putative quinol monooxygenase [Streptococcus ratti]|uniref:ABM domain-containing protein n=1 Tax=Streptococcus ratti FA-1 = DSM 20564 TaxID=699248 RepID=A0ABP2QYA2_STRRT|nr:antibiotic biosynthesis monooxygenase [Streptococcus ratti]EJN93824.1 hypothetical protein SRA_04781 [Streptococcus ratti FA-1 = DSM 20564]EMP69097.1 hypothetical protein D822_08612 [Streptococcus ratti FA-1 = DSM 20564]QEY07673.1 hypothetical protein FY406_08480 [Streptococcus ratti]VEI60134.1 antibiotic biosynthesis monooxygenase [Streptococcus mutans]